MNHRYRLSIGIAPHDYLGVRSGRGRLESALSASFSYASMAWARDARDSDDEMRCFGREYELPDVNVIGNRPIDEITETAS